MKIKNKILLPASFLLGTLFAQSHVNTNTNSSEEEFNYEKFFEEETPLKFSLRTIKWYADSLKPNLKTKSLKQTHGEKESRTTYFNQACLKYIKEVYNNRNFAQTISQDGSHFIAFLDLSDELSLDVNTTYVGLRLFYNKIKACELIDDTVILQILPHFKTYESFFHVDGHHTKKADLTFIKNMTERTILTKFTEEFDNFEHDPGIFLEETSEKISDKISEMFKKIERGMKRNFKKELLKERLRQLIIKFLEITLNKLMWETRSYEGIWTSFISIAHELEMLGRNEIIDYMDDLDDLLWSLTHRFCWFLDVACSVFPASFYEEIENDLNKGLIYFLEVPEQDEKIKTKKETLLDALMIAKTKAIAFEKGIILQAV